MHSSFTYNPNAHRTASSYQQNGFQQPIYNIGAPGLAQGFMSRQPNFFVNHQQPFVRSFASVVSCESDLIKRQQTNNGSGLIGSFLRHFNKPSMPQYHQPPPPSMPEQQHQHHQQNKEFEDFTHLPAMANGNIHPQYINQQHYFPQNHINMKFNPTQPSANSNNGQAYGPNFINQLFGGYQRPHQQQAPKNQRPWYNRGWRSCRGGRWKHQNRFHDRDENLPKNVHEKERTSIERNIQDDSCDFVDVSEDQEVMNHVPVDNNPNKTARGSCWLTIGTTVKPPSIFSLEEFPAISTATKRAAAKSSKSCISKKPSPPPVVKPIVTDKCEEEGFVVVPTEASISTPSISPKRISLCEQLIKSPQRLFPAKPIYITYPCALKSCLKPSKRKESECSDDIDIEFDYGSEASERLLDITFSDDESETDSEDEDEDDVDGMEGIEEGDEEMSDDEDEEAIEQQIDSGVEEKKVHFNMTPKVHVMRVWDYAYRSYRKGDYWQMMARDHERFKKRISEAENSIASVLGTKHRERIYGERFQDRD